MGTELPDGIAAAQASSSSSSPQTKKQLCSGTYRAQQVPGAVIIFADGWHPTSGFRTYLEESPIRIYPPQFSLLHEAPTGPVLTVMTPFTVWAMFSAHEPVAEVIVHDSTGKHTVKVEQVLDIKAAGRSSAMPTCEAKSWVISQPG